MTINDLKTYGADTENGLARCMNNENLYLRLVKMLSADPGFQKLKECIEKGDLDGAFNAAHAIKGSAGNLALTPIFDPVCEITELLRARTETDYAALLYTIMLKRDELARLCEK